MTEGALCFQWDEQIKGFNFFVGNSLIYCIILTNYILRETFIYLTSFVGFLRLSKEASLIKNSVFYVTFFNSSIIMILSSIRLDGRYFNKFFNGLFSDINAYWYMSIGESIVFAMVLNMFYPIIEFFLFWLIRWITRKIDQCRCSSIKKKKNNELQSTNRFPDN